jgi:hypothetical protein
VPIKISNDFKNFSIILYTFFTLLTLKEKKLEEVQGKFSPWAIPKRPKVFFSSPMKV